jgi:2-aminoethylphosphonate-pyruvate transaminase
VRDRGFVLYPGKLTSVDTFRVGCIGAIGADTMGRAVAAVGEVMGEMGVRCVARTCVGGAPVASAH